MYDFSQSLTGWLPGYLAMTRLQEVTAHGQEIVHHINH